MIFVCSLIINMASNSSSKSKKRPHGPLQRSGDQAKRWDTVIGKSIDTLPSTQLPTVRTILQRYRFFRIESPQLETIVLARRIAEEVLLIWDRARIPTKKLDACIQILCSLNHQIYCELNSC